ncbi:MAG TPA: hypothetical protein V6C52_14045 [Coleofasciculaceae cyanobacterium]|jgi:hypothetical protein
MIELRNKLPDNQVGTTFSRRSGMPAQAGSFAHGQDTPAPDMLTLKFGVRKSGSGNDTPPAGKLKPTSHKERPATGTAKKPPGTPKTPSTKRTSEPELAPAVEGAANVVQKGVNFWNESTLLNGSGPGSQIKKHPFLTAVAVVFAFNVGKGLLDQPIKVGHQAVKSFYENTIVGKDSPDQADNLAKITEGGIFALGLGGLFVGGRKVKKAVADTIDGRKQKKLEELAQLRAAVETTTKKVAKQVVQSEIKKLQKKSPQNTESRQGKNTDET